MQPFQRSQLREAMRLRADTEGWRALIGQHGTPLLVLDRYRVVEQCRLLASHLRGFRLHYAVKTSPHPAVLRAVAASGCGFDVATNAVELPDVAVASNGTVTITYGVAQSANSKLVTIIG